MAQKTTTKSTLKSSTTVKAPALSLVPAVKPQPKNSNRTYSEDLANKLVIAAIADEVIASQKSGTSSQRMTAAIMVQHLYWTANGIEGYEGQSAPTLADCFHKKDVREGYLELFRSRFITPIPEKATSDEKAAMDTANKAKKTLIDTGIKVAAILVTHGVTYEDFDYDTGMFSIDPKLLLPNLTAWRGLMASEHKPAKVTLDLASYSAVNLKMVNDKLVEGTPFKIRASVNALIAAEATKFVDEETGKVGRAPRTPAARTLQRAIRAAGPAEDCILTCDYLIKALVSKFKASKDRNMLHSAAGWLDAMEYTEMRESTEAAPGFDREKQDKANKKLAA